MIKVLFYVNSNEWKHDELERKLQQLPGSFRAAAMKYRKWQDRQNALMGKILLQKLINEFELSDKFLLTDLQYNAFNKPFLDDWFHFNISHSDNVVICAASVTTTLGIDIEKISAVNFEDFNNYFTTSEWSWINASAESDKRFFHLWTKKEAVLKASGKGITVDLTALEVLNKQTTFENRVYHLKELSITPGYVSYVATSFNENEITIKEIPQ